MIEIKRIYQTEKVTIGILSIDKEPFFWTLEEPWQKNLANKSCIPQGHYRAHEHRSSRFGQGYKITDLQNREPANRSGILIHAGNTIEDTSGCILLGLELGLMKGEKAVLKSKEALNSFMGKMYGVLSCDLIIC